MNEEKQDSSKLILELRTKAKVAQIRAYFSLFLILMFFISGIFYTYYASDISKFESQRKIINDLNLKNEDLKRTSIILRDINEDLRKKVDLLIDSIQSPKNK